MSGTDRLRDGQTFGRYQIVRLIGEGGMGAVYEALHPVLKKRFAIKTLLPAIAQKEEARARFLREGEAASSINHPHVVTVSDVGTEDGIPFLVMELLEGQTLGDLLAQRGSLGVEESLALLLPVISAVATGHDRGVIHRDLKPQNIFVAKGPWGDKIPKVLDFGVSKLTGDDNAAITRTLTVLGTAAYMSPEQARGAKRVDFRSDQYALGLIFYEMLTGSRAHPGESSLEILHNVASGVVRPVRELKPDLPDDLDAALTRMLAANPTERYPSLHDVGRDLIRLATDDTRLALKNAFGSPSGSPVANGSGSDVPERRKVATEQRSDSSASARAGATLPLSVPVSPSVTTLREAASEAAVVRGMTRSPAARFRRRIVVAAAGLIVLAGGIVWWSTRIPVEPVVAAASKPTGTEAAETTETPSPSKAASPSTIPFDIRVVPPDADIALDDLPPTRGRLEMVLPLAGKSHVLRISAEGYQTQVITFGPTDEPPAEIHLARDPAASSLQRADRSEPPSNRTATVLSLRSKSELRQPRKRSDSAGSAKSAAPMGSTKPEHTKDAEVSPQPKRGSNNALILN